MSEKIVKVKAVDQVYKDLQEYAFYVQEHRVVAGYQDGLKPVQRRILYAAYNITHATTNKKSAQIIGDTMGHYHPHGDSSIQGALYTMKNWYSTYIPLFDGQGNFGNTYQNVPASPRYTETRISNFALECVLDELISCHDVVDWIDNYDKSTKEPSCLPVKVPLLLINGCNGIAVGDRIDIPTHNINEVIDTTIALIKNPNADFVLAPDHCQACTIVDTDWRKINAEGKGNYTVRARIDIKEYDGPRKNYKGCMVLAIRAVPNLTYLEPIIEKIEKMVKENKIIGILDTEEHSEDNDLNYYIILKQGTDPNFIRNELYKNTNLQQTARVNFKVLDATAGDGEEKFKNLSYRGYILTWIEFRKITKFRFCVNKIRDFNTRSHVLANYIYAIESGIADDIIKIIKSNKSTDDNELIEKLIKKCNITDIQARFFINCEIKKLSKGYLNKHKEEYDKCLMKINELETIILKKGALEECIIQELLYIKSKYGFKRKCNFIKESEINGIPEGEFKIVLTENNFIKKIGVNDNVNKIKNDSVKFVTICDNSKNILLFDTMGKVFNLPVSKIPFGDKNSNGIDLRLINKNINAPIMNIVYGPMIEKYQKNGSIVTLTKDGYIKRMDLSDFIAVPSSGLVYCKIDQGDYMVGLMFVSGHCEVIVYGGKKGLRININDIPILKRNARGCMSMSSKNTILKGLSIALPTTSEIVVVTKNGFINRIIKDTISIGRSKAGSNLIKLGKTDEIVGVYGCNDNSILNIITSNAESTQINVNEIPKGTSIGTGVKIIKDNIIKVGVVI